MQHASTALLLGAAIVVGGGVEGGVVAFQVGWFVFLAPYGVIAQPIQTTVLPELAGSWSRGDRVDFASSVRWSLNSMTVLLLPIMAVLVVLARPVADVMAFGAARSGDGIDLIAAAVASLAAGLVSYGVYLLLARAWYAIGDSRTPAAVSVVTAVVGVAFMFGLGSRAEGARLVVTIGIAHTAVFTIAALVLGVGLRRRVGHPLWPRRLPIAILLAVIGGLVAWVSLRTWGPTDRLGMACSLVVLGGSLSLGYLACARWAGLIETPPTSAVGGGT